MGAQECRRPDHTNCHHRAAKPQRLQTFHPEVRISPPSTPRRLGSRFGRDENPQGHCPAWFDGLLCNWCTIKDRISGTQPLSVSSVTNPVISLPLLIPASLDRTEQSSLSDLNPRRRCNEPGAHHRAVASDVPSLATLAKSKYS